jgi:SAM-dependent methyltransferase
MPSPKADQFHEVAEVYDSLMSVVPYSWWVEYVELLWKWFGLQPRRVLDLACGTGCVTAKLLEHGYEVEGADYSEPMLRIARRKLPEHVALWHQDARELRIPGEPFDACVSLFDSLNYIVELEDLYRVFHAVRGHLAPEGSLVFDMNAIRALEKGMFNQQGTGSDASLEYDWQSAWEPASRLCTIRMEFRVHEHLGTRIFHEMHVQRGYTIEEVSRGLEQAGFRVLAVFDAFTMRQPTSKSDRYHFVAKVDSP